RKRQGPPLVYVAPSVADVRTCSCLHPTIRQHLPALSRCPGRPKAPARPVTKRSERRPRASAVRRAGRFRRMSQEEASCAMGSGRDGAGSGNTFWGEIVATVPPGRVTSAVGSVAEAPEGGHLGKISQEHSQWADKTPLVVGDCWEGG